VLSRPVTTADLRSVWVGLRPLVAPPESAEAGTKTISREHTIVVDPGGLVTVTGGKWTTYRAMAEDVLQRCFDAGLLSIRPPAHTEAHRLVGAPAPGTLTTPLYAEPGAHLYGTEAAAVAACPGADRLLASGLTESMVRFAVRAEHAQTVEDVLARRSRLLFLDARAAAAVAPEVARILADEGVPNPALESFLQLCAHHMPAGVSL
jgi:glycerol-3-phosphate dehydrogenase